MAAAVPPQQQQQQIALTDHSVVEQQDGLVALYETHAPHVSREVVHLLAPHRRRRAVRQGAEVGVREYAAEFLSQQKTRDTCFEEQEEEEVCGGTG